MVAMLSLCYHSISVVHKFALRSASHTIPILSPMFITPSLYFFNLLVEVRSCPVEAVLSTILSPGEGMAAVTSAVGVSVWMRDGEVEEDGR